MATIISTGFVIPANPPQPVYCVTGKRIVSQSVTAIWNHDCSPRGNPVLIEKQNIACPQRNDRRFLITIRDQNGNLEDVSGANEITFIVGRSVTVAPIITKTRGGGGITLTTNSQLQIDITDVESASLATGRNYYEILVESSSGDKQTVLAGAFIVEDTRIGD